MTASSARVRKIVELVSELNSDERAELEAELVAEDESVARAWSEEIERRAERALRGEAAPLSREQVDAILDMPSSEARAHLERVIVSRR